MKRAIVIAFLFFFGAIASARADDPTSLAEYQRVVERAAQLVTQSQGSVLDQRPALLKQAAALLANVREVQTDAGERITVNNESLVKELNAAAQDSQHLYISNSIPARLAALRAALADPPIAATDADLAKLREIYNQPPFAQTPVDNFFRQLVRQFFQWLENLLNRSDVNASIPSDLVTLAGIFVTFAVAIAFIIVLRRNLAAEAELQLSEDPEAVTTSRAALSNAQKLATAGDYRSAVRMLYLATLLLLDERGSLRYDKSLTNREYLRAVKNEPHVANALQPIVETFDKTWYGFENVTPEQFGEYEKKVNEVKKL
jgi:hypothetical protein